jgi:hypothetical protein
MRKMRRARSRVRTFTPFIAVASGSLFRTAARQAAIRQIAVAFHQANTLCICISYCQGIGRTLLFDDAGFAAN